MPGRPSRLLEPGCLRNQSSRVLGTWQTRVLADKPPEKGCQAHVGISRAKREGRALMLEQLRGHKCSAASELGIMRAQR